MKKTLIILFTLLIGTGVYAQDFIGKTIPSVSIKSLDGRVFNTSEIQNEGKPIVIAFWALWCKPCMRELTAIAEVYDEWVEETGVQFYAISIDDARSVPKVKPTVDGNGWEYEVYLDANQDFKRAMGVNMIPHLFVLDGEGKIVYQHTSYAEGNEDDLYELLQELAAGKVIKAH